MQEIDAAHDGPHCQLGAAQHCAGADHQERSIDEVYLKGYIEGEAFEVRATEIFRRWLLGLRDVRGRSRIIARIERLGEGNTGDARSVGDGVLELRIHTGPGYRVYFTRIGKSVVVLLAGGDKSSQIDDIRMARQLARDL